MAAAAVLSPSTSSGLSTPAESQFNSPLDTTTMTKQVTPIEPQTYFAAKMATVLHALNYDTTAINTLITRAESNTVEATDISADDFLGDTESISHFLDTTLLNPATLRERNIYLNSNEPVLLLGYSEALDLSVSQIKAIKEGVLAVLRERGLKPVRVYLRETADETNGLSFSLLNVVNSDIGVNMVSLLDSAFYGSAWKEELVAKEAYNGYDLIWRDEVWKESKEEVVGNDSVEEVEEIPAETDEVVDEADVVAAEVAGATAAPPAAVAALSAAPSHPTEVEGSKQDPVESESNGAELKRMPDAPVRSISYKSADDVPDSEEEEEPESVQHPALRELLEREAQKAPVQYPTWSRDHDGEAYLDIIKTHSRGQEDPESISVIARPEGERDDFEVVEKP